MAQLLKIEKDGKTTGWQVRWYAPDGTRKSKIFKRKSDARRYGNNMESAKARGLYNDPSLGKIRYEKWARHWLDSKIRLKPKTRETYESLLRTHVVPEFGKTPLNKIDPMQVQEWVADLDEFGLSNARMRAAYQLLSASLKAAVESGYLGRTPCVGISIPRVLKREKLYLSESEVELLANAIRYPYSVLIYVLAYGGLRWAEAVGLRRRHCDVLRGRLTIEETLSEVGGALHRGATKTYETRTVALPRFVRDALAEYLNENVETTRDALVFTSPDGNPLRSSNFRSRVWLPALKTLDGRVPLALTPHHLRHTCASLLIRSGAHAKAIQAHLGHSSITVTMDVYGHLFEDDMDELVSRLDTAHLRATKMATIDRGPVTPIAKREKV